MVGYHVAFFLLTQEDAIEQANIGRQPVGLSRESRAFLGGRGVGCPRHGSAPADGCAMTGRAEPRRGGGHRGPRRRVRVSILGLEWWEREIGEICKTLLYLNPRHPPAHAPFFFTTLNLSPPVLILAPLRRKADQGGQVGSLVVVFVSGAENLGNVGVRGAFHGPQLHAEQIYISSYLYCFQTGHSTSASHIAHHYQPWPLQN